MCRDGNMFVIVFNSGVAYTFNKDEATDVSNMSVKDFVKLKIEIEEKERCVLEIYYS